MLAALDRHIRNYPEVKAEAKRVLRETREQADVIQDLFCRAARRRHVDIGGRSARGQGPISQRRVRGH